LVKDAKSLVVAIFDVDGVMTSGTYFYTSDGKFMKEFGPDDHDALQLLKSHLEIRFVSADKRGFAISKRRIVEDMGFPLDLVSSHERLASIEKHWPLEQTVYMGDGGLVTLSFWTQKESVT
jgi:3-deoxy-D-manno-octulosonate 8-phosphate phosphatase (KDO 8-P phosphatase)